MYSHEHDNCINKQKYLYEVIYGTTYELHMNRYELQCICICVYGTTYEQIGKIYINLNTYKFKDNNIIII